MSVFSGEFFSRSFEKQGMHRNLVCHLILCSVAFSKDLAEQQFHARGCEMLCISTAGTSLTLFTLWEE